MSDSRSSWVNAGSDRPNYTCVFLVVAAFSVGLTAGVFMVRSAADKIIEEYDLRDRIMRGDLVLARQRGDLCNSLIEAK